MSMPSTGCGKDTARSSSRRSPEHRRTYYDQYIAAAYQRYMTLSNECAPRDLARVTRRSHSTPGETRHVWVGERPPSLSEIVRHQTLALLATGEGGMCREVRPTVHDETGAIALLEQGRDKPHRARERLRPRRDQVEVTS